jgi:hypothetical protein
MVKFPRFCIRPGIGFCIKRGQKGRPKLATYLCRGFPF